MTVENGSIQDFCFSSNEMRLSEKQWYSSGIILILFFLLAPVFWSAFERFSLSEDYRIPYKLSNDYWFFNRYCRAISGRNKILFFGDSVIWGQYVRRDQTITYYLNEQSGLDCFVNMGVDGMHPVAFSGLVKYYTEDISGESVIVHFNPLWLSSLKLDLQEDKELDFNHPKLVPQFSASIACYRNSLSDRIGIFLENHVPYMSWGSHLAIAYFGTEGFADWVLENPYSNPLAKLTAQLSEPEDKLNGNVSWQERGISQQYFGWVEPAESLQWSFFMKAIEDLRERENRVFVMVGPSNEYMLTEQSQVTYNAIKNQIEACLQEKGIRYCIVDRLPMDMYADASHPLPEGYVIVAKQLLDGGLLNWILTCKED